MEKYAIIQAQTHKPILMTESAWEIITYMTKTYQSKYAYNKYNGYLQTIDSQKDVSIVEALAKEGLELVVLQEALISNHIYKKVIKFQINGDKVEVLKDDYRTVKLEL